MSTVRFAKTAEPIDMSFWVWTQVDPRNNVLGGGGSAQGRANLGEESIPSPLYGMENIRLAIDIFNFIQ